MAKFTIPEQAHDKQWLKQELALGKHAQTLLGFSDELMGKMYQAAYEIHQEKRYADAAQAFLFLATLNPDQYDYWIGLGAATQRCGDYEGAIDAFEMAAICNIESPIPYFHLAQCLFAMHDRKSAQQAIEMAIEYSENIPEYEELHRQALAARTTLMHEE